MAAAAPCQPPAYDRLGLPAAMAIDPRRIGVGGVDEVPAGIHIRIEDGERRVLVGRPAEDVAAEAEGKHLQVGASDPVPAGPHRAADHSTCVADCHEREIRACVRSSSSTFGDANLPSLTTNLPPTIVCWAATGPQRRSASTGSDHAPANGTAGVDQTVTSPHAPGASSPIWPARPRQAAEPRVAMSSASCALMPV